MGIYLIGFCIALSILGLFFLLGYECNTTKFKKYANENNLEHKIVKKEYEAIIRGFEHKCDMCRHPVKIKTQVTEKKYKCLNANSGYSQTHIWITNTWIPKLLSRNRQWETAFMYDVGHELCHKMNEPTGRMWFGKKSYFKNWVRECRCDFFGIEFAMRTMPSVTRKDAIESYKLICQHNNQYSKDKPCKTHPSRKFRVYMLENYEKYDENAVRRIAKEAGLHDEAYLQKVLLEVKKAEPEI